MKRLVAAIYAMALVPFLWAAPAAADTARIMVPASAGGGWDGTARQTILALQQSGLFKDGTQFTNKGGAGVVDQPVGFGGVVFTPGHSLYADEDGIVVRADPV